MKARISDSVKNAIEPLFDADIRLVEVEYLKKQDGMHLVVYIDKEGGVDINDCVAVTNLINPVIDDLDPTGDEHYCLDVSSYGIDKPLKFDWQFKRYVGKKVQVKLYKKLNGKKDFVAEFVSKNENTYQFKLEDEILSLNITEVAQVLPYIEF